MTYETLCPFSIYGQPNPDLIQRLAIKGKGAEGYVLCHVGVRLKALDISSRKLVLHENCHGVQTCNALGGSAKIGCSELQPSR